MIKIKDRHLRIHRILGLLRAGVFATAVFVTTAAVANSHAGESAANKIITLLFTNDVESAYEPIDAFVWVSGADIGFVHSGSLRKDLPGGDVQMVDLLDTYPFVDDIIVTRMTGDQIQRAIKQSLTLERGLLQVSGLELHYDLSRPEGDRIVSLKRNGQEIKPADQFTVAAPAFLAEGGDLYVSFSESEAVQTFDKVSAVMLEYFRSRDIVAVPEPGRQIDVLK